jgi:starch synthase (maltosyl-transferring)
MELFGLPNGTQFEVTELITGTTYTWSNDNFIRLDSFTEPAQILAVTYPKGLSA